MQSLPPSSPTPSTVVASGATLGSGMTVAARQLDHQAFLYGSTDHFVAELAPLLRAGFERGDVAFVASKRENLAALSEELGEDAERVRLEDTTAWEVEPFGRLRAFRELIDSLPAGAGLTALGEPVWRGSPAVLRQWAHYESIINLALADAPTRFVCLYDGSALPDDILSHAVHTHPSRVEGGATVTCTQYAPPERFLPSGAPSPPTDASELPLSAHEFRAAVIDESLAAGAERARAEDFVVATNEVLTNALCYGEAPVRARLWTTPAELVCRIVDDGPGLDAPLAGWLAPSPVGSAAGGCRSRASSATRSRSRPRATAPPSRSTSRWTGASAR